RAASCPPAGYRPRPRRGPPHRTHHAPGTEEVGTHRPFGGARPVSGGRPQPACLSSISIALPLPSVSRREALCQRVTDHCRPVHGVGSEDRKSTRLNSSHVSIYYAAFCL